MWDSSLWRRSLCDFGFDRKAWCWKLHYLSLLRVTTPVFFVFQESLMKLYKNTNMLAEVYFTMLTYSKVEIISLFILRNHGTWKYWARNVLFIACKWIFKSLCEKPKHASCIFGADLIQSFFCFYRNAASLVFFQTFVEFPLIDWLIYLFILLTFITVQHLLGRWLVYHKIPQLLVLV